MKLLEETKSVSVRHGRWYDDACGTALALEVLGERWSLLVVRELLYGPLRFSDLRAALPGISAKVLTERLEGLEQAGALARRTLPPPGKVQVYELTPWGKAAEGVVLEMGRWALQSPLHNPRLHMSPAGLMVSFQIMIDRGKAAALPMRAGFDFGRTAILATLADGAITFQRGPIDGADIVFRASDATPLAAIIYGKVDPARYADQGVKVEGDAARVACFIDLFHLPARPGR
ncbi:winged helix-turn-helix transcriptional regulator [Alteraurantiacibacter palmitatis]|uniref:Winged helix-turn-helix transcriptional regulator n=1 Tax=Alteraurantiacibacter palmitatis TaxID=2054628 RepID=A0ABV7E455_9SPHN